MRASLAHPTDIAVGARIRAARKAAGISQSVLAQQAGITFQQIQKYEHGSNRISASRLVDMCDALNINVSDLLQGLQKTSPKERTSLDLSPEAARATMIFAVLTPARRRAALKLLKAFADTE